MILFILRGVFVVLAASVAMLYILGSQEGLAWGTSEVLLMVMFTLGVSTVAITVDVKTPDKKLSAISGVFLGLGAGLLAAYALSFVVDLIGVVLLPNVEVDRASLAKMTEDQIQELTGNQKRTFAYLNLLQGLKVFIGLVTCYTGISLVLQTKDDFRFVIPYVEFAKQIRGSRPVILDTSIIIDGRILEIINTKILQGSIIVPRFVLNELQLISDSSDKLKRSRGRRGLDILQKLQASTVVDIHIEEADSEGANVDQKLVSLAQEIRGRVMTNDFNLKKVAELRGVEIINLNDLTGAMRPVALPGEAMRVRMQKAGEGQGQGVGYLEDGTMVVVEGARDFIDKEIEFTVTSNFQTQAGRMIFGQYEGARASSGAHKENHKPEPTIPPAPEQEQAKPASPIAEEPAAPTPSPESPAAENKESRPQRNDDGPRKSNRPSGRNPRR